MEESPEVKPQKSPDQSPETLPDKQEDIIGYGGLRGALISASIISTQFVQVDSLFRILDFQIAL
jgi:hypothetical protein